MTDLMAKLKALISAEESETAEAAASTTEQPAAGEDAPPAWAQSLIDRLDKLESAVSPAAGDAVAGSTGAPPAAAPAPGSSSVTGGEPGAAPPQGAAPPATSTRPQGGWTDEQLQRMTPEQINKHWDSIAAQWQAEAR